VDAVSGRLTMQPHLELDQKCLPKCVPALVSLPRNLTNLAIREFHSARNREPYHDDHDYTGPLSALRRSQSHEEAYEMVNTYGVASENDTDAAAGSAESSALLGTERVPKKRDGHATMLSCVSNLTNTIIGSGADSLGLHIMRCSTHTE